MRLTMLRRIARRHRAVLAALVLSALVHAAALVGVPNGPQPFADEDAGPEYTATLDAPAPALEAPAPVAKPAPRHVARARPRLRPIAVPDEIAPVSAGAIDQQMEAPVIEPVIPDAVAQEAASAAAPDKLALAQPATPVAAMQPPTFPVEALPASIAIEYRLTSTFADGRARYTWSRDGDDYTIRGEAEAQGFFALFLEGRLRQESTGKVTAQGLRPDHFEEHKPGNPVAEGIQFDWARGKAILDKGDNKPKTVDIAGNTVDWLSMIFQLAHAPPTGESYDLRVFTQRRFYEFHLLVLGVEEIEIPLGQVRALHLRHVDPEDKSVIDVWLGIDQHYLPVKLRYPVARNRLMVEQVATGISQ